LINLGPIISFTCFYFYRYEIYDFCLIDKRGLHEHFEPRLSQDIGFKMGLWHFIKRVFECIFVHFYSKPTKSLTKVIWEMGYVWLLFGIVVPFYLFHPQYQDYFWQRQFLIPTHYIDFVYYLLTSVFIFGEVMNLMCHLHLKSFRKRDLDFNRQIPIYHGYSLVTCANYFWEFLSWCAFTLVTQTLMSVVFLVVSFFRMNYRAQRKHLRYIAEFKNAYPAEERRAFIPYLF
jgi:very-long-chain enoyl-CoA reductase